MVLQSSTETSLEQDMEERCGCMFLPCSRLVCTACQAQRLRWSRTWRKGVAVMVVSAEIMRYLAEAQRKLWKITCFQSVCASYFLSLEAYL